MTRAATRGGAEPSDADADAWLAELISEEAAAALSHGSRTAALGLGREVRLFSYADCRTKSD